MPYIWYYMWYGSSKTLGGNYIKLNRNNQLPSNLTIIRLIIERIRGRQLTRSVHGNAFIKFYYAVRFQLMFVQL